MHACIAHWVSNFRQWRCIDWQWLGRATKSLSLLGIAPWRTIKINFYRNALQWIHVKIYISVWHGDPLTETHFRLFEDIFFSNINGNTGIDSPVIGINDNNNNLCPGEIIGFWRMKKRACVIAIFAGWQPEIRTKLDSRYIFVYILYTTLVSSVLSYIDNNNIILTAHWLIFHHRIWYIPISIWNRKKETLCHCGHQVI